MLSNLDRKEAIRKFKERNPPTGAFALRSTASGRVWVGSSRNLDAVKNRLWFTLRHGSHPDKALQAEWSSHGDPSFHYEILEQLADDVSALSLADILKEKRRHWAQRLGGRELDGIA